MECTNIINSNIHVQTYKQLLLVQTSDTFRQNTHHDIFFVLNLWTERFPKFVSFNFFVKISFQILLHLRAGHLNSNVTPKQHDTCVMPKPRDTFVTPKPLDTCVMPKPHDTCVTPKPCDTGMNAQPSFQCADILYKSFAFMFAMPKYFRCCNRR